MKKVIASALGLMILFSCSNEESNVPNQLSKSEIDDIIQTTLEQTGDFDWTDKSADFILNATQYTNQTISIGYTTSEANENLIHVIQNFEGKGAIISNNDKLRILNVLVSQENTIAALLNHSAVRYIEPTGFDLTAIAETIESKANNFNIGEGDQPFGCTHRGIVLDKADFRTIAPGAKVSWHLDNHNIPDAWEQSTGQGVTIGVIDTGLSSGQQWMNEFFNDGYSQDRTIESYGLYSDDALPFSDNYDGTDDGCGHGTSMAALVTAPRNDDNLTVGVAYNANLVAYRATENVFVTNFNEQRGLSMALTALADREDVKIISISLGTPISNGMVEDAIKYAYSKGKLIFAAAGTSPAYNFYGVIFPANMEETIATTGVMEYAYEPCEGCHKGKEVDFTIAVQRESGNIVPTLSYFNGETNYTGGSSSSAATTAGIAALIWSKYPNWTREQVLQRIKESSEFYPKRDENFGYGNIDAYKAVQ